MGFELSRSAAVQQPAEGGEGGSGTGRKLRWWSSLGLRCSSRSRENDKLRIY